MLLSCLKLATLRFVTIELPDIKHDIKNPDFWDMMPYGLVEMLQRFTASIFVVTNSLHPE